MTVNVLRDGVITPLEESAVQPPQNDDQLRADRRIIAKRLCREKILDVVDETAQINLAAAAGAGALDASQLATFQSGVSWIMSMRATWPVLADDLTKDLQDNANWPQPTQAMLDLAGAF